jgi:hypothetical protein
MKDKRRLFLFGNPRFYGFFNGSGQVALSPAEFLDRF